MCLRLPDDGFIGEPPRQRAGLAVRLLADQREIALILRLLPHDLSEDRGVTVPLAGEQPDEDLVPQRGRPSRTPEEPYLERALAARGETEQTTETRPVAF